MKTQPQETLIAPELTSCPNCGGSGLRPFYSADQIPCHSVLLMETYEQAVNYPRADLRLSFCESCGFITNKFFDVSHNDYSQSYEETQHFSARFNSFAHGLVRRLIDQYDIRKKRVVEIGCGKGEFLGLLCELGDNRGVGIDPGCRPERFPPEWASRIDVIQELYSAEWAHLKADVICCRHTLEHIGPTQKFLQTIRDSIGDQDDTLVFFEVPDIRIVLEETRFWDVYYEHCSYFSLGSLARLFRSCHFEIVELQRDFDDQYALIVARPTASTTSPQLPEEDDLKDLSRLVSQFEIASQATIRSWQSRLREVHAAGWQVAVWGAGSKCVSFLTTTGLENEVCFVTDINPHKQDRFLPATGHQVTSPDDLAEQRPDVVLVMNPVYLEEIRAQLQSMNLRPELLAL
ncbi:MAG: methyltransferase domain-containing protein [Planctomycetes bacterium]|nr:methyltransferase domain-containing protein [Planctomycetota bacterium]